MRKATRWYSKQTAVLLDCFSMQSYVINLFESYLLEIEKQLQVNEIGKQLHTRLQFFK
jgi:hypothetical protein